MKKKRKRTKKSKRTTTATVATVARAVSSWIPKIRYYSGNRCVALSIRSLEFSFELPDWKLYTFLDPRWNDKTALRVIVIGPFCISWEVKK